MENQPVVREVKEIKFSNRTGIDLSNKLISEMEAHVKECNSHTLWGAIGRDEEIKFVSDLENIAFRFPLLHRGQSTISFPQSIIDLYLEEVSLLEEKLKTWSEINGSSTLKKLILAKRSNWIEKAQEEFEVSKFVAFTGVNVYVGNLNLDHDNDNTREEILDDIIKINSYDNLLHDIDIMIDDEGTNYIEVNLMGVLGHNFRVYKTY